MNPLAVGYLDEKELVDVGFKSIGSNIKIARNCTVIGPENISIGSNVRIDGNCTLVAADKGWINIGSYVHIGGYCLLAAAGGIELQDFSGLSHGVRLHSASDDFSGKYLTNPTVPDKFTNTMLATIVLKRHAILGSGTVVFPGVSVGEGSAVGAQSLVTKNLDPWGIFFGSPARRLKDRSRQLLELEKQLLENSDE